MIGLIISQIGRRTIGAAIAVVAIITVYLYISNLLDSVARANSAALSAQAVAQQMSDAAVRIKAQAEALERARAAAVADRRAMERRINDADAHCLDEILPNDLNDL